MRHFKIQLNDSVTQAAIVASGGVAYVAVNGDAQKATLYKADGSAQTNPVALTYGCIEFWTADSVPKVDLFVQSPSGHFVVAKNVVASGPNTLYVNKSGVNAVYVIPFSINDTTANTETATGFSFPANSLAIASGISVDVLTADSGMTIAAGTATADSGTPAGIITGLSLTSAATVKATLANSGVTFGSLMYVQDSANSGDHVPEPSSAVGGKGIVYTLSSSADTGEGFIKIPVQLPYASL